MTELRRKRDNSSTAATIARARRPDDAAAGRERLHDEVDELVRHDERRAAPARSGAPAPSRTPSRARSAPSSGSPAATRIRSRTLPFTCTTSSISSRSSCDSSATGHGSAHSRSWPSSRPQLLGDVRRVRLDQRHRRLGREARRRVVGRLRQLVHELHHGRDRRVEDEPPLDVVGHLRDRLVRLARERRAGRDAGRLALELLVHDAPQPAAGSATCPRRPCPATPCPGRPGP